MVLEEGVTTGQLERVFVAYVKAHPEEENKSSTIVFIKAAIKADLLKESEAIK